jgi:hypothetical protein
MKEIRNEKIVYTIDNKKNPGIHPFAQRDVVDLFLKGFNEKKLNSISKEISKSFPKMKGKIEKCIENAVQSEMYEELEVIQNLPALELALMAETLINLTSFKRKYSVGTESVGGPVDVAVISKGDGFIWIKRKHYFEPTLNPHFIAKYYKGGYCE